jgi:hypothetical protein
MMPHLKTLPEQLNICCVVQTQTPGGVGMDDWESEFAGEDEFVAEEEEEEEELNKGENDDTDYGD